MTEHIIQSSGTLLSDCEELYGRYGRYINKWRAFPLIQDGLKLAERRVLYSEYLTARKKFTKSAEVVGYCIGKLHPHGDSSAYGTLVQLCNCGLSDYNGNFGTSIGLHDEPPAAMRYTEVKMNEDVVKMAFQHLDFVPFEELELPTKEPIYLASKLPFCLLRKTNYCIGLGFGFKAYIPSYSKEDLIKRLKWLLTKQGQEPIIRPVTDCIFNKDDGPFKELLTKGTAKIPYKGKAKLDKINKCIIVNSISPARKWTSVLNKLKDEIQVQKSIGFIDESCGDKTEVVFKVIKRGQDLDKLFKTIQNSISGDVSFMCNMCDVDGNVKLVSVDEMLLTTYNVYKESNIKLLDFNINKCQQIIDELALVSKVKKVLPKWLKQCPDDLDGLINGVNSDTSIEKDVLKQMFEKYTIPRFLRCKTDTSETAKKMETFRDYKNKIDDFVWRLYE